MSARGPYRRYSQQFEIQLCTDIRTGKLEGHEAPKSYKLRANLVQMWLTQFDRGELDKEDAAASTVAGHEAQIAALERKVGQLAMELDLLKKTPRLRLVSDSENSSTISGLKPPRHLGTQSTWPCHQSQTRSQGNDEEWAACQTPAKF